MISIDINWWYQSIGINQVMVFTEQFFYYKGIGFTITGLFATAASAGLNHWLEFWWRMPVFEIILGILTSFFCYCPINWSYAS